MDQSLCKLTLVYPSAVAESLVDMLLSMDPPVRGFTTFAAEGHGFDFAKATIKERVRGRVERDVLVAVMPRANAASVLELIRHKLPVPHMAYWLEPVLECGRLIEEPAVSDAEAAVAPVALESHP